MVEQVCSKLKRECVRVNVSIETDEDDLVGGSTLIDGNVTFREGPVILAMRRGAVLLIDEIDRGSNKLMCIQGILEGKPYFNKKNGDVIHPASGFTVIATANTKGQGSDSGKYIAAQILDEAFLERFPITVEQEYPSAKVERTIIMNNMEQHSCVDEEFADKLVTWAEVIRKTYLEDAVDELISTRRLVHIVKAFSMFRDRQKAIELCVNRFDADTKNAFLDLYKKMEAPVEEAVAPIQENIVDEDIPF
jgi:MoxR-like ATPase